MQMYKIAQRKEDLLMPQYQQLKESQQFKTYNTKANEVFKQLQEDNQDSMNRMKKDLENGVIADILKFEDNNDAPHGEDDDDYAQYSIDEINEII